MPKWGSTFQCKNRATARSRLLRAIHCSWRSLTLWARRYSWGSGKYSRCSWTTFYEMHATLSLTGTDWSEAWWLWLVTREGPSWNLFNFAYRVDAAIRSLNALCGVRPALQPITLLENVSQITKSPKLDCCDYLVPGGGLFLRLPFRNMSLWSKSWYSEFSPHWNCSIIMETARLDGLLWSCRPFARYFTS